jgi:hypothetical protein
MNKSDGPIRVHIDGQTYIGGYTKGATGIIKFIGVPDDSRQTTGEDYTASQSLCCKGEKQ